MFSRVFLVFSSFLCFCRVFLSFLKFARFSRIFSVFSNRPGRFFLKFSRVCSSFLVFSNRPGRVKPRIAPKASEATNANLSVDIKNKKRYIFFMRNYSPKESSNNSQYKHALSRHALKLNSNNTTGYCNPCIKTKNPHK